MTLTYHIPVLAAESIDGLNLFAGADVVDATFGGGGHSRLILDQIAEGRLFAFDQDGDAAENLINDKRLYFIRHNFRYIKNFLNYYGVQKVDAIFADLGVSSHDFDVPDRGFSFRFEGNLDMRMNQNAKTDASKIINEYSEERLEQVFRMFGEIKNSRQLAAVICKKRNELRIKTTTQLKEIVSECTPRAIENKYLAQVFQALRIEVNDEMEALQEFLEISLKLLKTGGRLVVITYHSLEDRLCKNFMKTGNFDGKVQKDFFGNVTSPFKMVNKKVITPGAEELKVNSRSRSAKLRIAEKI
ncbi:MAG: 16S rRNA (cytosine(1402)-N(4))-methyltransferase RsmH [Bacteroidetes bacterium]|nr:MAG: 16S rRNA (cytosine(1402)-N(4))-methyltransferase RsmH [Bacteroidota bacterium]